MAPRQTLTADQVLRALEGLGIYNTSLPMGDKKLYTDLLKDYAKYSTPAFVEIDDPWTSRYLDNEKMIEAFSRLEEGLVPDEVIMEIGANYDGFTPTEQQHIKDYYDYVEKRNASIRERNYELGAATTGVGFANPNQQFDVPIETVQTQFRDTYGRKPMSEVFQQFADQAMKDWEASPGYKDKKTIKVSTGRQTTDIPFSQDPAAWLYNNSTNALTNLFNAAVVGSGKALAGKDLSGLLNKIGVGNVNNGLQVSAPEYTRIPAFDPKRYYAEEMAKMAENERNKDAIVQQTLNRMLTENYGSPFEAQLSQIPSRLDALAAASANKRKRR